jgi:hypothetical protein
MVADAGRSVDSLLVDGGAETMLARLMALFFDGSGPGGWRNEVPIRRVTGWSTFAPIEASKGFALLNETALSGLGAIVDDNNSACYDHIDDGLFMSTPGGPAQAPDAETSMHAVADTMEGWGMRVGQRSGPGQVDKYVGYVPRLSPARWELPDAKVIHLYEALTWLISYPIVKISFIDSVLGFGYGAHCYSAIFFVCLFQFST